MKFPSIPYWLKWIFALVPIVWIFRTIDARGMLEAAMALPWWGVPLMVAAVLLSMFLQGIRWWLLLKAFIPRISLLKVMSSHFAGIFYSIALPTSAAGDVVRTFLISKENDYAVAWGATWLSRIMGLMVLFIFSVVGFFILETTMPPTDRSGLRPVFVSILVFFFVLAVCVVLSFSKRITRPVRKAFRKFIPFEKALEIAEKVRNGIYQYRYKKLNLFVVFWVTVLVQLLLVAYTSVIIMAISGKFLFIECLTFIPMIEIVCLSVPLTPSGLGVRELLLKLMFDHIGLTAEQLGVYIMLGFLAICLKLVGGIPILLGLVKPRKAALHED